MAAQTRLPTSCAKFARLPGLPKSQFASAAVPARPVLASSGPCRSRVLVITSCTRGYASR